MDGLANMRLHGTRGERPLDRFVREAPHLFPLPSAARAEPSLRRGRHVGRDGFLALERTCYGVSWW
jgi:hypothetical protein